MGNEIYWLLKYIEENKIEILHAHFAPAAVFYKKLKTKTGLPFVVSFYGYDYEKALHDHPEFRKQYQALFRLADAFICEGPHGAGVLREMGCPKEKVHVVPLGVEVEQIPFYKREKRAGELKLVQVASFTEKKGHIYTVKAFAAALKDCPNMSLTLVGDERRPGVKQQVLDYIKKEKLGQKVTVLDWVDYDHLHEFLEPFHVFIHPSCYASDRDCEGGAPVILLEAQATGMPVISTTHCDIPNIVKDDETGILCPEKEVERLAEAIAYFYGLPGEEYQEWGIRARRWVEERFEMAAQGRRLSKVYSTLCKMGR